MAGKRRLSRCPQCGGAGTIPKQVQRRETETDADGKKRTVTYTDTVQVDCPTCDGSGQVVDFDG